MSNRFRLAVPIGIAGSATLAIGMAGVVSPTAALASQPQSASAYVVHGTLVVVGTPGSDTISLRPGVDPTTVIVGRGTAGQPLSFDRSDFTEVSVFLRQGHDTFTVDPSLRFADGALAVFGGSGDDTITGSSAGDVLFGGSGDDTIRGGDGNDMIFGGSGDDDVDGQRGTDTEFLGRGDDTALWLPGEGSDVIDGGRGRDVLNFVGSAADEVFAVRAQESHAILTRNIGGITMDTTDVEQLDLATLGGVDTVSVGDLTGTNLAVNNVDLSSGGTSDGQLDTVIVDGTAGPDHVVVDADGSTVDVVGLHTQTRLSGSDTRDQLQVDTGNGNDSADVSNAASALIHVAVDLGSDQP